jgi:excisionase family DNA binding protein
MPKEYLTVAEVADLLKLNSQTVRNWIDRGELPAVRVGSRRVRVRQSDLDAFIDAGATISPEPEAETEASVDEGSITAWATFGAALTETSARLESRTAISWSRRLTRWSWRRASSLTFSGRLRASRTLRFRSTVVGHLCVARWVVG